MGQVPVVHLEYSASRSFLFILSAYAVLLDSGIVVSWQLHEAHPLE